MSDAGAGERSILLERDGGILWLRFNRPEKRNALTSPMYEVLCAAVREARADDGVRVLAFTGAGDAFTAGNDLDDFSAWGDYLAAGRQPPVLDLIDAVADFDKPMLAAVRGPAAGIGTTLLLHCDVVLASQTARFSLPFTRLGLVPEFGASVLLPRVAGRTRAAHALLTAAPFGLEQAVSMGIVSEPCDDDRLDAVARDRARSLAALPPASLRATKRLLREGEDRESLLAAIAAEKKAFIAGLASAEHREAVAAFFDKRPPRFGD